MRALTFYLALMVLVALGAGMMLSNLAEGAGSNDPARGPVLGTTVASLPTCNAAAKGRQFVISDATTPAWNATVVGGGAVVVVVFCNGTNWVVE